MVIPSLTKHEFYIYDLELNLRGGNGAGDLLARLRATKTYLVDTNSSPKRLAGLFPQLNFVIGATHCEEAENLDGVLFSNIPPEGFPNLFVTEISPTPKPHIGFHRVSPHYRAVLNQIPPLSKNSAQHQKDRESAAAAFRRRVDQHLSRSPATIQSLLNAILPSCLNNYTLSARAAELLLAAYVQQSRAADAARLLRPNYLNLRGDPMLIAEALLYGFSIVSEDSDVQWMAKRAGVELATPSELATGSARL